MTNYLFKGLPPKVVTYIKVHLRDIYSTGLFESQEREDLIQDLVLFYLELIHKLTDVPDVKIFLALKTKADHIMRTRLRELQSGFLNTESLNNMFEDDGFEPESSFLFEDLVNHITLCEIRDLLNKKEKKFVELIISGEQIETAKKVLHTGNGIVSRIQEKLQAKIKK